MHTTFVPILVYSLAVALAAALKVLLWALWKISSRANDMKDNPTMLVAGLLAAVATCLGLFLAGDEVLQYWLKTHPAVSGALPGKA
jgi:hypothetical protein